MIKSNKGISLLSLVITIVIMTIIASVAINKSSDRLEINNINKMINDIELLEDKVSNYYLKYNVIPVVRDQNNNNQPIEYEYSTLLFDTDINDDKVYYILDLAAMDGITLNYGQEGFENINQSDDVYVINNKTHNIYYVKGIELDEIFYHSLLDNNEMLDQIPPSKPDLKIISGENNSQGEYITDVEVEIVPGKDSWSGVKQTTISISKDDSELTLEEIENLKENNIYTISENGTYIVKAKTQDNSNNFSEEVELTITINK